MLDRTGRSMHPVKWKWKRRRSLLLTVFLLLSFAALFLFYNFSYSLPFHSPSAAPNPSRKSGRFSFTVKLLTFDRIDSLRRCLRSLAAADYAGDRVDLHVFVDHFRANGSALVDRKLEEAHRILDFLDAFDWTHGEKLVHYRTSNAGLQAQWLEAWWPISDDEFAFVVEDDLELSPLYYKFLKGLIFKYYYDRSNYNPSIYGASLQRPRFVAGKHGNKLQLDSETRIFLYQMVGTWGQLLFPKPWKEFRLWYDVHKAKEIKPFLQGMVTTGWYKRFGERIWTPWFIKFVHSQGYYNIYTKFQHERALSISYRDAGVNYGRTAGPDSNLVDEKSLDFNVWDLPSTRNLKWYDFCFREVFPGSILRSFNELSSVLDTLANQKTILTISLFQTTQRVARNLFCNLERLGIRNFILLTDDSDFLRDLARRGYPAIDANQLFYTIRNQKSGQNSDTDLMKEIWVKAYIVKKCLELGFNLWLMNGNAIPVNSSLPELPDPLVDFASAKDVELMFVKSSPSSLRIWTDDYISKVVEIGKSLISDSSVSTNHRNFVYFVMKALNDIGGVRLWIFDESAIALKLGAELNRTAAEGKMNMVFWPKGMELNSIKRELENRDLWLIDVDSSCVAVVCHKK